MLAGLAFKASVAPFHQWTPDVYEGAPTPVTAFMAVATKAAAFAILLRLFDVALIAATTTGRRRWPRSPRSRSWSATSARSASPRSSGMLAYSSVAQAGYMLAGVVVATSLGVKATVFYLVVYLFMNMAAFAVVIARERETGARRRHHARCTGSAPSARGWRGR